MCVCVCVCFNQRYLNDYFVDNILDKKVSFVCIGLNYFNSSNFSYNPISLKDRTFSILTFSNRSLKLFTLKNRFLMRAKALHFISMCLTV